VPKSLPTNLTTTVAKALVSLKWLMMMQLALQSPLYMTLMLWIAKLLLTNLHLVLKAKEAALRRSLMVVVAAEAVAAMAAVEIAVAVDTVAVIAIVETAAAVDTTDINLINLPIDKTRSVYRTSFFYSYI